MVLDQRVEGALSLEAAHGEQGNLALERHEPFEDQRRAPELLPGMGDVVLAAQDDLALAIVAVAARLEHGGQANPLDRAVEVLAAIDRLEGRRRQAGFLKERLLGDTVLGRFESGGRRQYGEALLEEMRGGYRHILELVGDKVEPGGELLQIFEVLIGASNALGEVFRGRLG